MRADHDRLGSVAREARPEVAGLVDLDVDGQVRQPLAQEAPRTCPLVRPGQPARPAGAAGQFGQRAQVGDRALRLTGDLHVSATLVREQGDDVLAVGAEVILLCRRS